MHPKERAYVKSCIVYVAAAAVLGYGAIGLENTLPSALIEAMLTLAAIFAVIGVAYSFASFGLSDPWE